MNRQEYIPIIARELQEKFSYCDLSDEESVEISNNLLNEGGSEFEEGDYPGNEDSSEEFIAYWAFLEQIQLINSCKELQLNKAAIKVVLKYSVVEDLLLNFDFLKDVHFLNAGFKIRSFPSTLTCRA